jgi:hypothetical protein
MANPITPEPIDVIVTSIPEIKPGKLRSMPLFCGLIFLFAGGRKCCQTMVTEVAIRTNPTAWITSVSRLMLLQYTPNIQDIMMLLGMLQISINATIRQAIIFFMT